MEKKQKLLIKCCYHACTSDNSFNPTKPICFVSFAEPCLQVRQNSIVGSLEGHIIGCKQCERASKWVEACQSDSIRSIEDITENTFVCSMHFFGGDGPSEQFPDPIPLIKREVEMVAETPFVPAEVKEEIVEGEDSSVVREEEWVKSENIEIEEVNVVKIEEKEKSPIPGGSTQPDDHSDWTSSSSEEFEEEEDSCEEDSSQAPSYLQYMSEDDKMCRYFTGFTYEQISNLLKYVGVPPNLPPVGLLPIEQLMLVLSRLRRNSDIIDLSFRHQISSAKVIVELIKTWVLFMHRQFVKKLGSEMPKTADFKKLKSFHFLRKVSSVNNGGSMAPFVLVCMCLLQFKE